MVRGCVLGLALAAVAIFAAACGESADPGDDPIVAYVGRQPVYLHELRHYLEMNLVEMDLDDDAETIDEVKSRLLDALLEERLWIEEARRLKIEVGEAELDAYLAFAGSEPPLETDPHRDRELEARQRLMVEKLQEQIVLARPPIEDREVREYAEAHRDRLLPRQPVELRALQLSSLQQAERIYREIRRKRMTFREAVIRYEPSPGQAMARRVAWSGLSEDVQAALKDLKPGQVSKPLEIHGSIYIFQVASWLRDPDDLDLELTKRARRELEAVQRQEALAATLDEVRQRSRVRIQDKNLPFVYVPA